VGPDEYPEPLFGVSSELDAGVCQFFCGFLLAAGNRMLFRISR